MVIEEVDVIATKKMRKVKKKQMEDKRIKRKMVKSDAEAAHAQSMELLELNTMFSSLYTDTDVINYLRISIIKSFRFPRRNVGTKDRYGISDRLAASFASAVLQDIGIVHEGETSHVVDRNKILRQRKKI
ncbi:hypothetical protein AVEN_188268-1 [Araneus ventricosus]|uniref:Uncharacterized protein n=1 Tax=Araneus ventricosus TaxID=182803 RepID=A0A4Y2C3I1_ARAVE|nr:hypothetical protein AVEN_188268-1 [Araneus ventricosus]